MKITAIFVLMLSLYCYSLAIPHDAHERSEREYSNSSKYKYPISVNKTKITTTKDVRYIEASNVAITVDSGTEGIRGAIQKILENITTDESPRNITIDVSILSNEFLNCKHISVEPNCYQKLNNGSVFVPL